MGITDGIKEGIKEGVKAAVKETVKSSIQSAILMGLKARFGEDAVSEKVIAQQLLKITSKKKLSDLKKAVGEVSSIDEFMALLNK